MKLRIKKIRTVTKRNIFGAPIREEVRCYIYFLTWKGIRYVDFSFRNDNHTPTTPQSIHVKYVVCKFRRFRKDADFFDEGDANFILKDTIINPDKYELHK